VLPIQSTAPSSARVQNAYTMQATKRNAEINPNSRHSLFMIFLDPQERAVSSRARLCGRC